MENTAKKFSTILSHFFTLAFLFSFLFLFLFQYAQAFTCPDYFFSTDLAKGANSPDVRVIQEILNLDKRTVVAYNGPGSPGNETSFFGKGTREALKRFQALFIEYIGIANGKFGSRTRVSMNAVCKGPFFTGGGGGVYDPAKTSTSTVIKDTIPPIIAIAGPTSTDISTSFRAYVKGNEALKSPALSGLIIANATAQDLRKISSTTFSFLITPNTDAKNIISLQFEANSVSDLVGNTNENASNEWEVLVYGGATNTIATGTDPTDILNNILNTLPNATTTNCSNVTSVDVSDYSNPCYGKVTMTDKNSNNNQNQSQQGQDSSQMIMQLLQGLLKSLTGLGGGGQEAGGQVGGKSQCACSGLPTTGFLPYKGVGPRAVDFITKGESSGNFVGTEGPPPPICGQKKTPQGCQNPNLDMTGGFVGGTIQN